MSPSAFQCGSIPRQHRNLSTTVLSSSGICLQSWCPSPKHQWSSDSADRGLLAQCEGRASVHHDNRVLRPSTLRHFGHQHHHHCYAAGLQAMLRNYDIWRAEFI
ncbi:unnamed protein product [Calypogeia fissa]